MRIAVMGSGGVGGYFGGRLARGGADVTFIARGAHLAALKRDGLTVESPTDPFRLAEVRATDDPAAVGPVDLVLFCVKLWDTEAAARAAAPLVGPDTAVLSLQNGVLKDDMLRSVLPERALMGGVCYIAAALGRPGVVVRTGAMQRIVFGEFDGRVSERAQAFARACAAGGIDATVAPDIRREIWQKYVFLVGLSGATATTRLPIGPIRADPAARGFLLDLMRETVAVGRAHGVALPEDFAEDRLAFADTLPADMTSSLHHDLARGGRLEVPWLSGGVAALGQATGVPTPMNRAVAAILSPYAQGGAPG